MNKIANVMYKWNSEQQEYGLFFTPNDFEDLKSLVWHGYCVMSFEKLLGDYEKLFSDEMIEDEAYSMEDFREMLLDQIVNNTYYDLPELVDEYNNLKDII